MSILDKIISTLSPSKKKTMQQTKHAFGPRMYRSGGASHTKKSLLGWLAKGLDADRDIVDNIETLRSRSRDLYMTVPLATGAVKTIRTNVVGSGLSLSPQIDAEFLGLSDEEAKAWENSVEREWRLWAETVNCDAERRQNFYQLQALILTSALLSGDVFVTLPVVKRAGSIYDLRIGLIEADRVCDPIGKNTEGKNIAGGIEIGDLGETVAVWIAKHHPYAIPRSTKDFRQDWTRVQAFGTKTGRRNILHVMADVERPAQRRGVPLLAPVIESLKQLGRYSDAELMGAVVSSMFTVFVKSDRVAAGAPFAMSIPPGMQVDPDPVAYELGNGSVVSLDPGESVDFADPKRPNSAFEGFVQAICHEVGSALELPYELLIKHFTASYSAARASLLEAWKMFRMRREWLASGVCQPVYEEWLSEAVLKGRIEAPGFFADPAIKAAWCGAEWFGDAQGQLNPLDEANAAKIRVEEGFSTRERETAELTGMQYSRVAATRAREETQRREAGLADSASV